MSTTHLYRSYGGAYTESKKEYPQIIHYTTSEFKYVVNRRGEAEWIICIFKLASGVIILSRAAKPKTRTVQSRAVQSRGLSNR